MKKSGFIDGAIIAIIAIFFTKFLGIIYAIPFNSMVGSSGGALYGYAYNIYNLFLIISSAGIPLAMSKLVSEFNEQGKYQEKKFLFKSTNFIILIFSIISFLICFFFAKDLATLIIGNKIEGNTISDVTYVIKAISFAILVVPLLSVSRGYLQGHGYISAPSISQIIEQIIRIIVVLLGSYLVLYVFKLDIKSAIGVACYAAAVGAIIAYIYLTFKLFKIKDNKKYDKVLNKNDKIVIIKKMIIYAIPFVFINIANNLYNTTDMILLNRTLFNIGFNGHDIDAISSVFTTWGVKINTIITSIATGLAISLVPNIAKEKAKNNIEGIKNSFIKVIQIFLYIALPLAIFISIFASKVWLIFFGSNNTYGPSIIRYSILVASFDALYIMISNGLQGLGKTKLIYTSVILGLGINLALDVPLMYLFNYLNLYPYYGAITATLIGYIISLLIPFIALKKELNLDYHIIYNKLPKLIIIYLVMIFLSLISCVIINNVQSRLLLILLIGIIGLILLIIYYLYNKKEFNNIFGKDIGKKLKREAK